jgi:SAM-dependent methyltransferase
VADGQRVSVPRPKGTTAKAHWERIYAEKDPEQLSWHEATPERSLALIEATKLSHGAAILDVGGGTSGLASQLLDAGYTDITVIDISRPALNASQARLGNAAGRVKWVEGDVRTHGFGRQFDVWHDRAVFHFMVEPADRQGYLRVLRRTLRPDGHLIIATFGPDGPTRCSGLPVARYGAQDLSRRLGREFEFVWTTTEVHVTPSGNQQQFLYAHFQRNGLN